MKTEEELAALKEKIKALNKQLAELSEDELKQVTGGSDERTVRLPDPPEFWYGWNPCAVADDARSDTPEFTDSDDYIHKLTNE